MNAPPRLIFAVTASLVLGALSAGCTGLAGNELAPDEGPKPAPASTAGRLTVRWTLNGAAVASSCDLAGAAQVRITPFTLEGQPVGEFSRECQRFVATIDLPPGSYEGTALLVNDRGEALSRTMDLPPFTLVTGGNQVVDVDFSTRVTVR